MSAKLKASTKTSAKELKSKPEAVLHPITITAFTVCKAERSSNSAQSFELKIENGRVTAIREISRAPDLPVTVITKVVHRLWEMFRTQYSKDVLGEPFQATDLS